ncbi:MAG: type II toxin-antitoxin system VapC family toxin [Candidatus Sulfobium sp.]
MRALLDTHAFLWWLTDDPQLPRKTVPEKPDVFISDQLSLNGIGSLPVQSSHALHVFNLPPLHRDPFDRVLVSQAQLENMPIITSDPLIALYQVKLIW